MNRTAHDSKIRRAKGTSFGMSNILSSGLSFVFVALSALLIVNSVKTVSTAYQRSLLLDQAEHEVRELRLRNLELLQQLEYVSSKSFVELEARNRLLYTKNGEVLLVIPQTDKKAHEEEVLGDIDDTAGEESDGMDRWLTILRDGV
jgi:cell division protein FtsB